MASSNVELVRSILEEQERGDFTSANWAHPEIEFVRVDGPSPGRWTGLAGLDAGTRDWLNAWKDVRLVVDDVRDLDAERVLVLIELSARGRASGLEIGQIWTKGAQVFHVEDGRVTKLVHYLNRDRAFADLGLPPG